MLSGYSRWFTRHDYPTEAILQKQFRPFLPEQVVELLVSMARGIQSGEFSYVDDSLSVILNRPQSTLPDFLKSL